MAFARADFNYMIVCVEVGSAQDSFDCFIAGKKILRYPNRRSPSSLPFCGHKKIHLFRFIRSKKAYNNTGRIRNAIILRFHPSSIVLYALLANPKNRTHKVYGNLQIQNNLIIKDICHFVKPEANSILIFSWFSLDVITS